MAVKGDLLTLIKSFLFERQQTVVLNGQESDNQTLCASGSFFWSIIFLKMIIKIIIFLKNFLNNLLGNLEANVKLFADDTSMFPVVSNPIKTSQKLNKNLYKVGLWTKNWKMSVNPNPLKQAQEVIFLMADNQSISIINSKAFGDTS